MNWQYSVIPDLTDAQYKRWQHLLEVRTGIFFAEHKSILQVGLTRRMREVDCLDYEKYYRQVEKKDSGAIEWAALLNALTVKETSFFRHPEAFDYVNAYLRDLLLGCADRELNLWSVGCATGEEAYTLAMIVHACIENYAADDIATASFGVTATDISGAALKSARKGRYSKRQMMQVKEPDIKRYFEEVDEEGATIVPWLKQQVCFVQANAVDMQSMPVSEMDVIYCQNMLVYFKPACQGEVLDNLAQRLKPGGLLVIGLGEAISWRNPKIRRLSEDKIQAYVRI